MTENTIRLALLGTGLMGIPIGLNLLRAGHELTVWNRTAAKATPLVEKGAVFAQSPAAAATNADLVITLLTDGKAVEEVLFEHGVAKAMKHGSVLVDMGSIKPDEAKAHALALNKLGVAHLDAPVSGGTKGAEQATLAIMVGGAQDIFEKAKPVLEILGRPVRVGPSGSGQLAKLANQAIVGATIGIVAEAMLMLERGGADPAAVRDALKGGFADSTILQLHGKRMSERDFTPGGYSSVQLKDMNNILAEAETLGLELPLSKHIQERYDRLCNEMDMAEIDHSGLFMELLSRNQR